jgi:hypothetical protein
MRVCFVRASRQNVFFDELVGAFRDGLEGRGVEVLEAVDHFPPPEDDLVYVFVPHEYLPLVHADSQPTWRQLRRSVAICTEQPGTTWFDTAADVAEQCGAAVDINELGVEALRKRGVHAELVRLGYVPAWDRWGGEDSERPIDLTFMGGHADRRGVALARLGVVLQDRRSAIHVFETLKPHHADDPHFLSGDRKWDVLRQAKTILNVHRSELAYMEWQRVLGAMVNGCVVVTEHSLGYQPFVPGYHFVSARFDDLPLAVEAILSDPGRMADIRRNAYNFLRDELPMDGAVEGLLRAIDAVARLPVAPADPGEPRAVPRPLEPVLPEPPFAHGEWTDAAVARMALKHLAMEMRALRSEVRSLRDGVEAQPPEDVIETFGPTDVVPRVSVVVTVYNYAGFVREALMSVARSDHDAYELIVIDDHSADHSVDVVREALQAAPWVPSRLVRRGRNGGLAAARNLGFELARSELVFVLDADNAIYPHALARLEAALNDDPEAAFAYGVIEAFNEDGPGSIMSYLGWDPERLRYGNFVDAMAMTRRDVVRSVGGYVSEPALYGWEDFALWCALASEGWHGVRVPEIVARYRVSKHSMVAVTNIDDTAAWAALLRHYPVLTDPRVSARAAAPA